jgi:fumarylpyruvate hydrolase
MTAFLFDPPKAPAVPVAGRDALFPVRRILCVGRNYAAHRAEMGGDDREPPFFFAKPADAVVPLGGTIRYPSMTADLHHEVELVAALGAGGADVPVEKAAELICGYGVGVDLTRRDLQAAARAKGQPWDAAKGFDHAAPVSAIRLGADLPGSSRIRLTVNGETRQDADIAEMIWNTQEIIAQASRLWRLEAGDLIFTGTPAGVGPLVAGDAVHAEVDAVGALDFAIVR